MTKKLKMEINDVKNSFSSMTKEEKTQVLLDYAIECYENGHKPSKKDIRRKFHVEIYNYFKNTPDYHRKTGIEVSLRNYPKEKARKFIIEFVQNCSKDGFYPNRKEVEISLKICLTGYFDDLKDLYCRAGVDYQLAQNEIKNKILLSHTYSKSEIEAQRKEILHFIKANVANGFYPSVHHIQKSLNLSFYNLYHDIFEAYKYAEVEYERPSPILLGKKKEEVFTKIVKELFVKMGYKIVRISIESEKDFNRYSDMTIENKGGKKYLVEIKAYRKDYCVTKREFKQLANYLEIENISGGIIITTSNSKKCGFKQIKFINGENLIELLKSYGLLHYFEQIHWIQNSRVNSKEKEEHREMMKNKILNYANSRNSVPTKREIQEKFRMDIRSVFGEEKPYEKLKKEIEKLSSLTPRT